MDAKGRLKLQSTLAAGVLALGLGLLTTMIVVEDEPGLLPLVMVVTGGAWLAITRWRARRGSR